MPTLPNDTENALVHLKDRLINEIDSALDQDPEHAHKALTEVVVVLEHVEELFGTIYLNNYKIRELAERVMTTIPRILEKLGPRAEVLPRLFAKLNKRASAIRYREESSLHPAF